MNIWYELPKDISNLPFYERIKENVDRQYQNSLNTTLQSHTSLTRFHYQFSPFNQAFVIICDDLSEIFFLLWWELKRIPYGDSIYFWFAIFIQNLLWRWEIVDWLLIYFINLDLQQKHPFLMVNIIPRVHVVRMVLKHRLVDKQTTQQAGPFQRRDRYSHLKEIWYNIARYVYQL